MGDVGDGVFSQYYQTHLDPGRKRNAARTTQAVLESMYRRVLAELAINRFKWTGLPTTVDERFLEATLYFHALAVFYWDTEYERYMALRASGTGPINHYDNPTKFTVTGNLMFSSKVLSAGTTYLEDPTTRELVPVPSQCVPIWANTLRCPDLDIVNVYAAKLARIDTTVDIAVRNSRFTKILTSDENGRLSMANFNRMVEEGLPYIEVSGTFDPSAIQALDVGPTHGVISELAIQRTRLWNECMGLLGINNANQDKKERLVADEVAANDEQVMATKNIAMASRRYAAGLINDRYDLHVDVQWNPDMDATYRGMVGTGAF